MSTRRPRYLWLVLAALLAAVVAASLYYGGGTDHPVSEPVATEPGIAEVPPEPPADAAWAQRGQRAYRTQCLACHQADGAGSRGVFPPLAGHVPRLLAAENGRAYIIGVVLFGVTGPTQVDGQRYDGRMPALRRLDDQDVAAVVNYVAKAWDNARHLPDAFEPVTADEVAAIRAERLSAREVHARRPVLD